MSARQAISVIHPYIVCAYVLHKRLGLYCRAKSNASGSPLVGIGELFRRAMKLGTLWMAIRTGSRGALTGLIFSS